MQKADFKLYEKLIKRQFRLDNLKENILADILPLLVDTFIRKKLSAFSKTVGT